MTPVNQAAELLAADSRDVRTWYMVEVHAKTGKTEALLLRRILGWDESQLPTWLADHKGKRLRVTSTRLPNGFNFQSDEADKALTIPSLALRRIEPWLDTFLNEEPSSRQWGLSLPCTVYEAWCSDVDHEIALALWLGLPDADFDWLDESGVAPRHVGAPGDPGALGYAGSTVIHVPQVRPFLWDPLESTCRHASLSIL